MAGLRGHDRTPRDDVRARRNAQRLASTFTQMLGDGFETDAAGLLAVDVQVPIFVDGSGVGLKYSTGLRLDGINLKTKDTEIVHNDLSGIQGGAAGDYYHLTAVKHGHIDQDVKTTANPLFASVKTNRWYDSDGVAFIEWDALALQTPSNFFPAALCTDEIRDHDRLLTLNLSADPWVLDAGLQVTNLEATTAVKTAKLNTNSFYSLDDVTQLAALVGANFILYPPVKFMATPTISAISDGTYLLDMGADPWVLNAGFSVGTNPLVAGELSNTAGDLKIQPDVQGDVALFGDTDVGDAVDGKKLIIHRKAAEGDDTLELFVEKQGWAKISASDNLRIYADGGSIMTLYSGGVLFPDNKIYAFGTSADYSFGYASATDKLHLVDGTNLAANIRMTLDSVGDFDFQAGNLTTTGIFQGNYKSSDGTAGITQSETGVTNFDIVIKDGLITSFIKN